MNLDEVAAQLRPREGVQAIDLGLLLGRRFWPAIMKVWLLFVLPVLVVVQTAVSIAFNPWVGVAVGWWLKPLFDRVVLHVVSRGFFGATPSATETIRTVIGQWWSRSALEDLTWRRPLGDRSVTMPVFVLEGNERWELKDRLRSLYSDDSRSRGWLLAIMGLTFKGVFYVGIAVLVMTLAPAESIAQWTAVLDFSVEDANQGVVIGVVVATTALATTIVEPFFSAGGFGVYIQRRIEREAWDLEIRFRRLAERLENLVDSGAGLVVAAGLAALVAGLGVGPAAAQAETPDEPDAAPVVDQTEYESEQPQPPVDTTAVPVDDPQQQLDDILGEAPFDPEPATETRWVPVDEPEPADDPWLDLELDWMSTVTSAIANIAWVLMWAGFILVVGFVLYRTFEFWRMDAETATRESDRGARWRDELQADDTDRLEIEADDDVAAVVRHRWSAGERRRALAAVVLESLLTFEERHDVEFPVGWTLARCAREVRDIRPEGPVVVELTRVFDELAWAGRAPSDEEFDALIERWERAFEGPGGADA